MAQPPPTTKISAKAAATECFRGGFLLHVLKGRWVSLFASFLVMAGAGGTYLFGVYSKEIKSVLGYDQTTLNLLGFFKDLGANVGVPAGLLAEVTPTWFVLLAGAALNLAGYLMIWLAVTQKIATPKVWHMCIYICVGANSQNFANTGALVTSVRNFPEGRGIMIGLLKGYTGLSGAIMTQVYLAVYGNDSKSLILLIGWLPAAVSVIFVYTIRTIDDGRKPNETRIFYHFLYTSMALAVFIMTVTLIEKMVPFTKAAYAGCVTVVIVLLFLPLLISIREELHVWNAKKMEQAANSHNSSFTDIVEHPQAREEGKKLEEKPRVNWFADIFFNKPERGEDYSILQALLSIDMMILFFATFCGLGTSLTAVDNLGQIGESLGYPLKTVKTFTSLLSIWNYFGRIFAGFVSEALLEKYKFPRTLMMTAVLVLSGIGYIMIAISFPGSIYIASIIIGFAFGAQLPLLFAIISELFGLKYYSTLFNCGQLASPLGSYILNVKVTGPLYDHEAVKDLKRRGFNRSSVRELTCLGPQCYRSAFLILAGTTFVGALASLFLVMRTREFYKGDIYKKFREQVEAAEKETGVKANENEQVGEQSESKSDERR